MSCLNSPPPREQPRQPHPALSTEALGKTRHDRLGAGQRAEGCNQPRKTYSLRHLLYRKLVPLAGPPNPAPHPCALEKPRLKSQRPDGSIATQLSASQRDEFPYTKHSSPLHPSIYRPTKMLEINISIRIENRSRHQRILFRYTLSF
jgi:hypothetical protein